MHTFKSFLAKAVAAHHQGVVPHRVVQEGYPPHIQKIASEMGVHPSWIDKNSASFGSRNPRKPNRTIKKAVKEESEQLDELKTSTLGNYAVTASKDLQHQAVIDAKYQKDYHYSNDPGVKKALGRFILKKTHIINKRRDGIKRAVDSLMKKKD